MSIILSSNIQPENVLIKHHWFRSRLKDFPRVWPVFVVDPFSWTGTYPWNHPTTWIETVRKNPPWREMAVLGLGKSYQIHVTNIPLVRRSWVRPGLRPHAFAEDGAFSKARESWHGFALLQGGEVDLEIVNGMYMTETNIAPMLVSGRVSNFDLTF